MAETELSVVCKNCGAEVSPYVTECPYCGTRIRKRAPKLERHGDELQARETRRARRRRRRAPSAGHAASRLAFLATERPYVTLAAILGPAALLVVQRAADLSLFDLGVIDAVVVQHRVVAVPRRPVRLRRPRLPVRDRAGDGALRPLPRAAARRGGDADPADRLRGARGAGGPGARRGPRRRRHADGRRQRDRAGRASAPGGSCAAPTPATTRPRSTTGSRWRSPPACSCCCPWWRIWPTRGRGSSAAWSGWRAGSRPRSGDAEPRPRAR